MSSLLALAFATLLQPQDARFTPGEPSEKYWPVSGRVSLPDGMEVTVAARRIERRWDPRDGVFREVVSETMRRRAFANVNKSAFTASLKSAFPGIYEIAVATEDSQHAEGRVALGRIARMFGGSADHVKRLFDAADKAEGFLREIEALIAKGVPLNEKEGDAFRERLTRVEVAVDDAARETDFTAAVDMFKGVYFQLRNCQVLGTPSGVKDDQAANDGIESRKDVFLTKDLTIQELRAIVASVKRVLASEIKVSTATLLDRLFERGREDSRELGKAREAAREAAKLVKASPEPDASYAQFLEEASRSTSDADAVREGLKRAVQGLVR